MTLIELMRLPEYAGRSACDFRVANVDDPGTRWQVYGAGGVWLTTEHRVYKREGDR